MVAATTDNQNKTVDRGERSDKVQEGAKQALGTEAARDMAGGAKSGIGNDAAIKPNPLAGHDGAMKFGADHPTVGKYLASADNTGKPADAAAKAADASDRGLEKANPGRDQVTKDYTATLERAGMTHEQAEKSANDTYDRLSKLKDGKHLSGDSTPEEQMARINKAASDILDRSGTKGDRLANGQHDYLTQADRQNMVKDLAAREADPDKYCKQGAHMTCALESMQKQQLEGQDPAKVAEQMASVTNKGFADVTQADGTTRRVNVDSRSLAPDQESGRPFDPAYHGDQGKRGMAGQAMDALSGQLAADLKAEREGKPTSASGIDKAAYTYMAAHADQLGARPGQTHTGEGFFARQPDGSQKMTADNPNMNFWDIAHLNKAMGGQDGAVFINKSFLGSDKPPAGYPQDLKVSTFSSTEELRQKLGEFQNRTGQSGQLGVNAPFLPGGGEDGHGMHAMNISLNGDGSFRLNNNWSKQYDMAKVSDDVVDKATNPDRWNPSHNRPADGTPGPVPGPDGEAKPNDHTIFRPGSGRNPNETSADAQTRNQDDTWQKLLEEQRKKDDQKRVDDEKKHREELLRQQEELDRRIREGLNYNQDL